MRARAAIQAIIAGQAALIYQDQVHHYTLRAMSPGRQHCYSQRRQAAGDELGLVTSQATMINHCCLTGYIASYLLSL